MNKGYYATFLQKKVLESGKPKQIKRIEKKAQPTDLSDVEADACRFLVESSVIQPIEPQTRAILSASLTGSRFRGLFALGRLLNIRASPPTGGDFAGTVKAVAFLVAGLQEKGALPLTTSVDRIVKNSVPDVMHVLVGCHQYVLREMSGPSTLRAISTWLRSLGMRPVVGDEWFARKLPLLEDRARNGELMRNMCIVFRPEVFDEKPPPATTAVEMAKRNRQALAVLAEEGAIETSDIGRADDIVRGANDAFETILMKVKVEYERREKSALVQLEFMRNL